MKLAYLKKNVFTLTVFALLCGSFVSCANDVGLVDGGGYDKISRGLIPANECTAKIKLYLVGADSSKTWYTWAWDNKQNNYGSSTWKKFANKLTVDADEKRALSVEIMVKPNDDFNFLFVAGEGSPQTSDFKITAEKIGAGGKNFFFIYGDGTIYDSVTDCLGLKSASVISKDGNTLSAYLLTGGVEVKKEDITVKGSDGTAFTVSQVELKDNHATITLSDGNIAKRPYIVTYDNEEVVAEIVSDLIDELEMTYKGNDLGLTLNGGSATFKAWAPLASEVTLVLFTDAKLDKTTEKTQKMEKDTTGVWTAKDVPVSEYNYYQYEIKNGSGATRVSDIWHTVAGGDSVASQIASIDAPSAKPDGWEAKYTNPFTGSDYTDAVIYEMHIRDWSRIENPNSTGKFLEIANSKKIIDHLKDLGVTHVQILPMFDYAQKNDDEKYNWGYNPYHYNVPEGRYVTKGYTDGTQAVKEMRTMIQKLHEAGIAVIMDVVYNHTSGTGEGSLYDMTVPEYFYRMKNGSYSNGSGCGNEVATNHEMVKKYVIDSLKHWMNDYHINGFRFDLMGVHESETMKEIYDELYKIDSKVMVYGEPWTGGDSAVVGSADKATAGTNGMGAGAFDDDFRDSIKGAEFGGFKKGQVQGTYSDSGIIKGLTGAATKRNDTGMPGLSLHYVECHDNYTLFDKLAYSTVPGISGDDIVSKFPATLTEEQLALIKKQDKLAAAYIFLAQGTPFINGGQEFMRTKQGNPDSYAADTKGGKTWTEAEVNKCNTVDLSFKTKYSDVYNTYKGLIALRKANPEAFGSNKNAEAETVKDADGKNINGVTKYTTGDFVVYFNATDEDYGNFIDVSGSALGLGVNDINVGFTFSASGKIVTVGDSSEKGYSIAENDTVTKVVPAHSFVILKK